MLSTDSAMGLLESPTKANRQIATVWERFVATGQFGNASPRPVIADGWRRCRALGISPAAVRAPSVMESKEVERVLATASLGVAGREVLQSYALCLEGSGHVLVLADASGHILYAAGERDTRDRLERINFMPGGHWAEDVVGPNGVGTPLKLGHPEVVLGTEHFCQGWQPWVCFGSPIRDAESGDIIGVVDITGSVRHAHIETMALTIAIAQSIEQRLQLREYNRREHLHTQFLELKQRWPRDGLILLSRTGRILDANWTAVNLLSRTDGALRNRRLVEVAPDLARGLQGLRINGAEFFDAIERDIEIPCPLRLRLEMLRDGQGRLAGYLLVLCRRDAGGAVNASADGRQSLTAPIPTPPPKSLRETEDELIRRTLLECEGEMSRAARRLGIARSTLYRRLKRRPKA